MGDEEELLVRGIYNWNNYQCMQAAAVALGLDLHVITPPGELTAEGKNRLSLHQFEAEITGHSNLLKFWGTAENLRAQKCERSLG